MVPNENILFTVKVHYDFGAPEGNWETTANGQKVFRDSSVVTLGIDVDIPNQTLRDAMSSGIYPNLSLKTESQAKDCIPQINRMIWDVVMNFGSRIREWNLVSNPNSDYILIPSGTPVACFDWDEYPSAPQSYNVRNTVQFFDLRKHVVYHAGFNYINVNTGLGSNIRTDKHLQHLREVCERTHMILDTGADSMRYVIVRSDILQMYRFFNVVGVVT